MKRIAQIVTLLALLFVVYAGQQIIYRPSANQWQAYIIDCRDSIKVTSDSTGDLEMPVHNIGGGAYNVITIHRLSPVSYIAVVWADRDNWMGRRVGGYKFEGNIPYEESKGHQMRYEIALMSIVNEKLNSHKPCQ